MAPKRKDHQNTPSPAAKAARLLPLPLALLDAAGRVTFANQAMQKLLGTDPSGQAPLGETVMRTLQSHGRAEVSLPGGSTVLQWTASAGGSVLWGAEVLSPAGRRHTPPPGGVAHELEQVLARLLAYAPPGLMVERRYDESLPMPRRHEPLREAFRAVLQPLLARLAATPEPVLRLVLCRDGTGALLRITHNAPGDALALPAALEGAGFQVSEVNTSLGGTCTLVLPL